MEAFVSTSAAVRAVLKVDEVELHAMLEHLVREGFDLNADQYVSFVIRIRNQVPKEEKKNG